MSEAPKPSHLLLDAAPTDEEVKIGETPGIACNQRGSGA